MPTLSQESDDLRRRGQQQQQQQDQGSGDGSSVGGGNGSGIPAAAFAYSPSPLNTFLRVGGNYSIGSPPYNIKLNLRNIAFMMIGIFIVRNLIFSGYGKESIDSLNNSGMEHEEIAQQGARESVLGEMDQLHLKKRQAHEEQLMKDHPNFKPSNNRLRKTMDGNGVATS